MLNIVLVEPEIPANTGNIGRTCVLVGACLHLVGPLGFSMDDHALKRAGLAYWKSLNVQSYANWDEFVNKNPEVQREVALSNSQSAPSQEHHVHLLTKAAQQLYSDCSYHDNDWIVFGKESGGLDRELIDAHPELCERIPMLNDDSLSNSKEWQQSHEQLHPELQKDICGNFVDSREGQVSSFNLSNSVAIVLFEALRQLQFLGLH